MSKHSIVLRNVSFSVNKILLFIVIIQVVNAENDLNVITNLKKQREYEMVKEKLTKLQFEVTQNCGTEPPFKNE